MCRILGIIGHEDILPRLLVGLYSQGYAGEKTTGIGIWQDGHIRVQTGLGPPNVVFPIINPSFAGEVGIGHNACRTSLIQPKTANHIAWCTDASMTANEQISTILNQSSSMDLHGLKETVRRIMKQLTEPFALVILTSSCLIAARNNGRKPLTIGRINRQGYGGFYIASQSGVLPDGRFLQSIDPGVEAVVRRDSYELTVVLEDPDCAYCINEDLYKQRPGNVSGFREIGAIREEMGRQLAIKFRRQFHGNVDRLLAIPILEGGRRLTMGFRQVDIHADPAGSVRNNYSMTPTMIAQAEKIGLGKNFSLQPLDIVRGKIVIIVDDQMRSGRKIAHMAKRCYRLGALEVHAACGSIGRSTCPYGEAAYDGKRLIGTELSNEKIAEELGVESLTTLEFEELIAIVGTSDRTYCHKCLV